MVNKMMGCAAWNQTPLKTAKSNCNSIDLVPRIKKAVVSMAVWDWFLINLVDWIIHRGGLSND